jgi:hypothetical protein
MRFTIILNVNFALLGQRANKGKFTLACGSLKRSIEFKPNTHDKRMKGNCNGSCMNNGQGFYELIMKNLKRGLTMVASLLGRKFRFNDASKGQCALFGVCSEKNSLASPYIMGRYCYPLFLFNR